MEKEKEKVKEEVKEEVKGADEAVAAEVSSKTTIDKANEAAKRIEEANAKTEELVKRQEAAKVEETLGGKTEAGTGQEEESPEEYMKKVVANDVEAKNT